MQPLTFADRLMFAPTRAARLWARPGTGPPHLRGAGPRLSDGA